MKKKELFEKYLYWKSFIWGLSILVLQVFPVSEIFADPIREKIYGDAEQQKVSGTVEEVTGAALPGVTVIQKGTTKGTITDNEGKFTIDVPEGSVLIFSFIGFTTQEIPVTGGILNVTLEESLVKINEVVAIGYGNLKSSHVSSAIAKVKSDGLDERPTSRIDHAIAGKLAGVQGSGNQWQPGKRTDCKSPWRRFDKLFNCSVICG